VAVAARRKDRLDALVERAPAGAKMLALETDVTDEDQVRRMVEATVSELGRLDTLINNAGVMLLGPIEGAPTEEWRRMVNLNVLGLLYCTHAALPHLLAAAEDEPRRVADVVNVSSVAGRVARRDSGVYNATKWGVVAFSESLRQEVTTRHVRVTIIEPGATKSELAFHNRREVLEQMAQNFAGIEMLESEDIANAVVYAVTQPRHVAVNEVLVRPTEQER
jgi:NADP-dependent 3-hydroxy acid dehydrogenase YdfG